jgi:polar amino acid transport system substrate-binding protein
MDFRLQKLSMVTHIFLPSVLFAFAVAFNFVPAFGQGTQSAAKLPRTIDATDRLQRGDLTGFTRLRFLTTLDYPPYNYLSADGRLSGFNIDLTRAICKELAAENLCQVQAMPWEDLDKSLLGGNGEAVIAGRIADGKARAQMSFSRPYMRTAARFIARKADKLDLSSGLQKTAIGVAAGTAHEQMLRSYFPKSEIVAVAGEEAAAQLLLGGKVGAVFGDASTLSFWLASANSKDCCAFASGPFFSDEFLGTGMRIAVKAEDSALEQSLNFALKNLQDKGLLDELYLKFFPLGIY